VEVAIGCDHSLPDGTVLLPDDGGFGEIRSLRLGCTTVAAQRAERGLQGELVLSPDLWTRLAVPYGRIRLDARPAADGELILGPAVAVLYAGRVSRHSTREAEERMRTFFGARAGEAGLFALGFDESIDWDAGVMDGFVLDNRGCSDMHIVAARFPIPAAVHLRWAIRREVIDRLRTLTGGKVFNWVRNMSKWQFHSLLSTDRGLAEYLPDTRLLNSMVDLAAMLARHGTVFVKQVFGIRGMGMARIRRVPEGFELSHIERGAMVDRVVSQPADLMPALRQTLGSGRLIVQEGLDLVGLRGRKLDFRVLAVREPGAGWRCAFRHAKVAPDERLAFINLANGAQDADMPAALAEHYGLAPESAEQVADDLTQLALRAAETLSAALDPVGILGIDLAVDARTRQIYLLEANTVPGWGYAEAVEEALARSQTEYALSLTR